MQSQALTSHHDTGLRGQKLHLVPISRRTLVDVHCCTNDKIIVRQHRKTKTTRERQSPPPLLPIPSPLRNRTLLVSSLLSSPNTPKTQQSTQQDGFRSQQTSKTNKRQTKLPVCPTKILQGGTRQHDSPAPHTSRRPVGSRSISACGDTASMTRAYHQEQAVNKHTKARRQKRRKDLKRQHTNQEQEILT